MVNNQLLFIKENAQSILEYTIVLGVVGAVVFAMLPMLKRGTQSLIKVVADQVGIQQGAEQAFDERGHLEHSYALTRSAMDKKTFDVVGMTTYVYNDVTTLNTTSSVNLGFTKDR